MLDIKAIRQDAEPVRQSLKKRGHSLADLEQLMELDQQHRDLQVQVDNFRQERNLASQSIGVLKKAGQDISETREAVRKLGDELHALEEKMKDVDQARDTILLRIPNILHESVPTGTDESDNVEIRRWGEFPAMNFEPKAHDEIGLALDMMDFERAAKLAGARFSVMKGWGARLERALTNFMLDTHVDKHGYTEIIPPIISNRETMTANGNLPKFEEDLFAIANWDYFLIPTAEVPLTNMHRGEILEKEDLPKYYTAFTPCFRSEAGAAGRDTRGLIRLHQFSKVEMVKVVEPETSFDELESMVNNAETILQALELPYRVVILSSGDTGFNASKTYDIEVWFPSQQKYREISSCSNCTDYQARRGMLRYRPEPGAKPVNPHTLNGSGLPLGRTLAALIENQQQADGSILIPKALQPYLGGKVVIS